MQTIKETLHALRHSEPQFDIRSFRKEGFTGGKKVYHWVGGSTCRTRRKDREKELRRMGSYSRIVKGLELSMYDFASLSEKKTCKVCLIQFRDAIKGGKGSNAAYLACLK